jgi:mannose-6-phosphate isomerase-like protein (cupin superfamily)
MLRRRANGPIMQGYLRVSDSLGYLPGPNGERFVELLKHGTLTVELYAPHRTDPQHPHTRDEVYVVVSGTGRFLRGDEQVVFERGDVLFVAAGEVHRFVDFSQDFVAWVFFYGPEGGETETQLAK